MRLAILSDIHGNLEALEAVLADAKIRGYDRLLCLGDVVGYGADPEACVQRIRQVVWRAFGVDAVVKGNHDDATANGVDDDFNPAAKEAVRWTREHISDETFAWLTKLPMVVETSGVFLVHASPYKPDEWIYVTTYDEASDAFAAFNQKVAFIGHSHVPFHVLTDLTYTRIERDDREKIRMMSGFRYLVNVGSVGQPRDGDPRACYEMVDLEEEILERIRVTYPIEIASDKIRRAGLPCFLADRLLKGR